MLVGALAGTPRPSPPFRLVGVLLALTLAVLLTAAGVVSLLWLTANTCTEMVSPVGYACSSSVITVEGVAVGGALILVALGIALLATVPRLRQ